MLSDTSQMLRMHYILLIYVIRLFYRHAVCVYTFKMCVMDLHTISERDGD